jgi:ABC-type Fe3+-hydroxamate transport system substrate-binding protein
VSTPPRIVSLVPSMTETLVAWGIPPVACTRFCEQPDLVHVGGTKDPAVDAIVDLAPDLVIVDTEENRLEDHAALVDAGLDVSVLSIRSFDDVDEQLGSLAGKVGATWVPLARPERPTVNLTAFVPIWRRPWMALGAPTYGTSVLGLLGIANVFGDAGSYPEIDLDEAVARRPDRVIAPDEPYPFGERHRHELETVAPAVMVDGRDLLWWGERTRTAIPRLAAKLG